MDLWLDVDFGSTQTGLSPQFRFYKADSTDATARTATGVVSMLGGCYGVFATSIPADAVGIEWDDGVPTLYAHESIEEKRRQFDIEADTAEIGVAGAGLSAVPWNASWDAEVESEVADALNAYDPPTNTEMLAATAVTDALVIVADAAIDAVATTIGVAGAGLTAIDLPDQTMNITGNLSGSVGSVTDSVGQTGDTFALANGLQGFAAIDTVVDAILLDTDELQTNQGDWATANVSGIETKLEADARQVAIIAATAATDVLVAASDAKIDTLTTNVAAIDVRATLVEKILRNKMITDPVAGTITIYDDDDTVLLTAPLYDDVAGTVPYNGTGADRRDRMT